MGLTERGRFTNTSLDENGKTIFNSLSDMGLRIFATSSTTIPVVTIISVSKSKISAVADGSNYSVVTFSFDVDVTGWEVRVSGAGNGTGVLADSGGAITANTPITATIDNSEGLVSGDNRVNIYGNDSAGWTPYNS